MSKIQPDSLLYGCKEMHPWIETFNRIKKHGNRKYSVLGNHDYGECHLAYRAIKKIISGYKKIFMEKLISCLNEHTYTKGNDKSR
jgi:hypothetical protein